LWKEWHCHGVALTGLEWGGWSMLGAAGVAGADCLTGGKPAMSQGSISLLVIGVVKSEGE